MLETSSDMCTSDKVPAVREAACRLLSALFVSMGNEHPSVASTIRTMKKTQPKILSKIMKMNGNDNDNANNKKQMLCW